MVVIYTLRQIKQKKAAIVAVGGNSFIKHPQNQFVEDEKLEAPKTCCCTLTCLKQRWECGDWPEI
jgi:hypothetical protein